VVCCTCDGSLFAGGSSLCVDFDVSFTSGLLACGVSCQIDTQGCVGAPVGFCGDGVINDAGVLILFSIWVVCWFVVLIVCWIRVVV